ncbi:Hydantoinase/oxoprolinase N-terminal region-domain-containing protein [Exophiala viscosa]|uniref:Hydantoinase/oxoprolinase N-terminal region-domain-containing protein n=1 Tax=Exophiala viscosa TaxID=2486360 RepID=UPI002194656A|nr:Hydantoinase/oxoprolinase N-terminal region-domain-containing protein [Exophiala viscosa]
MGSISNAFPFRIGVDVGGTNTDAVILDTNATDRSRSVVAAHKTATTSPNVTDGIEVAVRQVLEQSRVPKEQISSLTIGTTHFINAIIEHDHRHLSKVAVIRLSKNFTREIPPFFDFPSSLRSIMYGWHTYVDGGLQIDGSQEAPIVEQQVIDACSTIKDLGLTAIVVCGVFSPLDSFFSQEQRVRDIIYQHHPEASVVCSSEISNLGFLERENASILNASIYRFAQRTISGFKLAMRKLSLRCTLCLTQNDGTLIDAHSASRLPIRTFSSGPTNSMRGAAYLSGLYSSSRERAGLYERDGPRTTRRGAREGSQK